VPVSEWTIADRYRIAERLGTGGTADVFKAHDELLDRDVAVKVFRPATIDDHELDSAERREAELQSLARLNHPNLIRLLDGSVGPDGPAYLVLDLVCGPDLAARLQEGPLPEPDVRAIGRQIANALDYAHAQGLVHRDVKPANILLGNDGPGGTVWARLSDFGTVRMVDGARFTATDLTVGTASYIAPEQARGAAVGPAADIYSLGLILIEALTGQRCFPGTTPDALAERLERTPDVPDTLPADLSALLLAMTAVDPADRPTAAAVAESLQASVPPSVAAAADAETTTSLRVIPAAVAVDAASAELSAPGVVPPVVVPPAAEPVADEPPARRRSNILFALAALALAALLTGAAFLAFGTPASNDVETPGGTYLPSAPGSHGRTHAPTTDASQQVSGPSSAPSKSPTHSPSQTQRSNAGPAPAPQPTTSAVQPTAPRTTATPSPTASPTSSPTPTPTPSVSSTAAATTAAATTAAAVEPTP
jgi:serine/threonine protein kinase